MKSNNARPDPEALSNVTKMILKSELKRNIKEIDYEN